MKMSQYHYNKNQTNREADRKMLLNKSFADRVKILASVGAKYGVKIYPAKTEDGPKCVDFIRECPKHGPQPVKLNAMVVRGNFACHHCINEIQGQLCKTAMGTN